jgi:hypothetical protein
MKFRCARLITILIVSLMAGACENVLAASPADGGPPVFVERGNASRVMESIREPKNVVDFLKNINLAIETHLFADEAFYTDEHLKRFFGASLLQHGKSTAIINRVDFLPRTPGEPGNNVHVALSRRALPDRRYETEIRFHFYDFVFPSCPVVASIFQGTCGKYHGDNVTVEATAFGWRRNDASLFVQTGEISNLSFSEIVPRPSVFTKRFDASMSTGQIAAGLLPPTSFSGLLENLKVVFDLHLLQNDDFYDEAILAQVFGTYKLDRIGGPKEKNFRLRPAAGLANSSSMPEIYLQSGSPVRNTSSLRVVFPLAGAPSIAGLAYAFGEDWRPVPPDAQPHALEPSPWTYGYRHRDGTVELNFSLYEPDKVESIWIYEIRPTR